MAVMIKTLSQLPDPTGGIDGTTIWHEISKTMLDPSLTTTDRYWSSWKIPLSDEVLYTIYSASEEQPCGLSALGLDDNQQAAVAGIVNGSNVPGVLKTLEIRNKLAGDFNLSAMRAQLCAIVGNYTQGISNDGDYSSLHLAGSVTAINDDVFKIGLDKSGNVNYADFKDTSAVVVPNARSVYDFTKEALPILLAADSGFDTEYTSESDTKTSYSGAKNAIRKETVPHDAYIFKIDNGGTTSNEWTAPASGWFTCFGWLSEISEGTAANYQRWVALEGDIGGDNNWCVLQLQPFIASPYISYVGFGVPVKKGIKLRIKTGFSVGASSGNYAMSNVATRSSMANHIANAFVGGIYSA